MKMKSEKTEAQLKGSSAKPLSQSVIGFRAEDPWGAVDGQKTPALLSSPRAVPARQFVLQEEI